MDFLLNKYLPATNKEFEGVKFFMLEGDRGEGANSIAMLVCCESLDARNRYWPGAGSPSDEFRAIMQKLQPLVEEHNKLASYTSVYTEWVIK